MRLFTKHKLREQELEYRDAFVQGLGFSHLPYRGIDDLTHVDRWEEIKRLLGKVDWSGWRTDLERLGFSVYLHFYMDTYPSLKATRSREQFTISVGVDTFGPAEDATWQVTAKVALEKLLPEIYGFKFVFDRGWNGRVIYGGGVWYDREMPQGPAPLLPPLEKLGGLIAEQEEKAQDLVDLLKGLGKEEKQ